MDYAPTAASNDRGAADEVHGESGDDFVYGMRGGDVLFGDGQNDTLIGGYDADWISGGTGDGGILGDDGRIFVSRDSASFGEPLYGIAALAAGAINQVISTSSGAFVGVVNISGALKYTVDLVPENLQPDQLTPPDPSFRPLYANDLIYGGLGNDSIHGGAGDDAISGAEAPVVSYTNNYDEMTGLQLNPAPIESDFAHPVNPGNVLGYNPSTTMFAFYDANDPLRKTLLDPANGSLWKGAAGDGYEWILNYREAEGPVDTFWIQGQRKYPGVPTDGDDYVFGDLGNDWLVGGTGRDRMYSGWGDDLLNLDDNLNTAGGLNTGCDTNPSYEDLAYGGAGRDVLLINTNGDRGVDWVGEFNSFFTPFAQFGSVSVSRFQQPSVPEFLYAISASDGVDPTLAAHYGGDPARNGEPFGELGLVTHQDAASGDQTGASRDPQPGNTGGGKVDLRNNPGTAGVLPNYGAPVVGNDTFSVDEDDSLGLIISADDLLANDSGPDGGSLMITSVTQPSHGTLEPNGDGIWKYTPTADYFGPDGFTYTVADEAGDTASATVTINVTPVNDPPTAGNDAFTTILNTALPISGASLLANDSDIDGDLLTITSFTPPSHGSAHRRPARDGSRPGLAGLDLPGACRRSHV